MILSKSYYNSKILERKGIFLDVTLFIYILLCIWISNSKEIDTKFLDINFKVGKGFKQLKNSDNIITRGYIGFKIEKNVISIK